MSVKIHNPLDSGWYADPEARFYQGKYYIYVTHSLPFDQQHNHSCFVSADLENWEKIENIIDMTTFPWVKRAVWAPTVEEVGGKYYYIFASGDIHSTSEKGGLEIAVSDRPEGPYEDKPVVVSVAPSGVEGSEMYPINGTDTWVMIMDEYGKGRFFMQQTENLRDYKPVAREDYEMDFSPRHGSVMEISDEEYERLVDRYGF